LDPPVRLWHFEIQRQTLALGEAEAFAARPEGLDRGWQDRSEIPFPAIPRHHLQADQSPQLERSIVSHSATPKHAASDALQRWRAHGRRRAHLQPLSAICRRRLALEDNTAGATRMPVDTLLSNWAYMVMAALAWTLKAWFALRLPETWRWAARYAAENLRPREHVRPGTV